MHPRMKFQDENNYMNMKTKRMKTRRIYLGR